ncbi:UDP-N-acetyl-D-mannosamine dehydrogenase [Ochrobactrum teleogrylli]|uniref:UDP-N-acetyl-D-mannosamine dehydrogenase n=1 Tax=Ochrobactrum teleogrylli TaxID=2479765 RepID=UPI00384EC9D4
MQRSFAYETLCVIGLGYIGLPTATVFAQHGLKVQGVDVNASVIATINRGEVHIVEPGLEKCVKQVVLNGNLRASTLVDPADAFLIAVPTPFKGSDHEPDLSYIEAAARAIAPVLKAGDLVVLESTSPVGATQKMADWLAESRPDLTFPQDAAEASDIRIAHCPERVLPGKVLDELVHNDRIIGGITPLCAAAAQALYEVCVTGECIATDVRTAEMCKLAENAFRDVNIAYANELSLICDRSGIDVWELIRLANRHPRVDILQPGAGVGGHCIAVDPWFIVAGAPDLAQLVRTARHVNNAKPEWVLQKLRIAAEHFELAHEGRKPIIAVCGLSFKPDIDDLRESPALEITVALQEEFGAQVMVVEPNIEELPPRLSAARLVDIAVAREEADILLVLVGHRSFQYLADTPLRPNQSVIDVVGLLANKRTALHDKALLNAIEG